MRIVAVVLNIICLIYVVVKLVADIGDYYFDTAGFYLLLCLCFIINLIALRRLRGNRHLVRHYKKEAARQERTELVENDS